MRFKFGHRIQHIFKKIEKVQMRATKQITCIKHLTYAERLSYLNLSTLHYRRIRGDMIMVFKYYGKHGIM